jgi:hypothetical protein
MKSEWQSELASIHEVGHLFALRHYGYNVESVEVRGDSGRTDIPWQKFTSFDLIVALCAGQVAEDKWLGWSSAESWRRSAEHKKAFDICLKASNHDGKAALLLMQWAERMASTIVEQNWSKLDEVAKVLAERGKLKVMNGKHCPARKL